MTAATETYPATVTKVDDPEKRGRIKVTCAGLVGDDESELPMWVEPSPQWGWFAVPDVGEIVEVVANVSSDQDETPGETSVGGIGLRWRGARLYGNESGEAPTPIHDDLLANYPKRRGFATPAGHVLYFDDTDGALEITLSWTNGQKRSSLTIDKDGKITLDNKGDQKITMDDAAIVLDHKGQHKITLKDGEVDVDLTGAPSLKLTGNAATALLKVGADAAVQSLAVAEQLMAMWNAFAIVWQAHIHPSAAGPTGPTPAPLTPWMPTIVSTQAKVVS